MVVFMAFVYWRNRFLVNQLIIDMVKVIFVKVSTIKNIRDLIIPWYYPCLVWLTFGLCWVEIFFFLLRYCIVWLNSDNILPGICQYRLATMAFVIFLLNLSQLLCLSRSWLISCQPFQNLKQIIVWLFWYDLIS